MEGKENQDKEKLTTLDYFRMVIFLILLIVVLIFSFFAANEVMKIDKYMYMTDEISTTSHAATYFAGSTGASTAEEQPEARELMIYYAVKRYEAGLKSGDIQSGSDFDSYLTQAIQYVTYEEVGMTEEEIRKIFNSVQDFYDSKEKIDK